MSTGQPPGGDPMSAGRQPSEEELRAAYEAELKKIRVEHIVLEQVVSLVNLGMRRTGLAPGTEDERDEHAVVRQKASQEGPPEKLWVSGAVERWSNDDTGLAANGKRAAARSAVTPA